MKNIKDKRAFSLTEMLVSIVVAAILVLTIGVISSISTGTYAGLTKEAQVYNDISYGFKLMQNKVRSSNNQIIISPVSSPWVSQQLNVGANKFGIYQNGSMNEFSYFDGVKREVIFAVPSNQVFNLTFPLFSTDSATVRVDGEILRVDGEKDKIKFDMSTTILRRAG